MKHIIKLLFISFFLFLLSTSCKKPVSQQVKHIPKSASFVAVVNVKSISTKMLQNQAIIESILKSRTGTDTSAEKGKKEWEELRNSGLDLDKDFYLTTTQKDGDITSGKGTMVVAALGAVTDAGKLEQYIKKKIPDSEIRKEKNYSFASIEGQNMIAWNNELVIAMTYQNQAANQLEYDSAAGEFNFKNPVSAENNLKAEMDNYFTMKEDMSVAAIPEFRELMQTKTDACMWVNATGYMDAIPMPRVKELFQNTYSSYTMNFEDGKIVVEGKSYLSKQLKDIYEKHSKAQADMSLIEKYPSDQINGFIVAGIDPQMINDIVKFIEVGGLIDAQLTKMMGTNFTLQNLLNAFKGDMAFVASDFMMRSAVNPSGGLLTQMPGIKMLGNIAIGDKAEMNKLLDKMTEMKMLEKTTGGYTLSPEAKRLGMTASIDDKNILIASNDTIINGYKSGTKKVSVDKEIMEMGKGKSVVFYLNIQSLINGAKNSYSNDSTKNALFVKANETFRDMVATLDKPNGNSIESHFELRLVNQKENSLTSVLKFAEAAAKSINSVQQPAKDIINDSIPVTRN